MTEKITRGGDAFPDELQEARKRLEKRDAGLIKADGEGASVRARAVMTKWLPNLTEKLTQFLKAPTTEPSLRAFFALIVNLDPAVLAACMLQGALEGIGLKEGYLETALRVGGNIYLECFGAGLFKSYPKVTAQGIEKRYARRPRVGARVVVQALYKAGAWGEEERLRAGNWGVDQLLEVLPDAFVIEERERKERKTRGRMHDRQYEMALCLTAGASADAEQAVIDLIYRTPVWRPTLSEPAKWQAWDRGGTSDKRLIGTLTIVRNRNKKMERAVRKAMRDGTMKPTVDALNTLQRVPWTINKQVLDVLRACITQRVQVDGVPTATADRVMFELDMQTAEALSAHERFWTAMNLDWRGRVYGVPSFNFQRDDRVRALFLFADGAPIGNEGFYWLKVHVANCFGQVSKRPFDDRVRWVEEKLGEIERIAAAPLRELWWTKASEPFQFLAASLELTAALVKGPDFVSRLPISFDGSCSGFQHLSAMTRDAETAKLVNLTPEDNPQDIYQVVADRTVQCVKEDSVRGNGAHLAQMWLSYGIDRGVVKRNVMTYVYGSTLFGMAGQLREDVIEPLARKAKRGDLTKQQFGNESYKASFYLARVVHAAIKGMAGRPAYAMQFLQRLAAVLARHSACLEWTTPAGFPWANRYYKPKTKQVRLYLRRVGVPFRVLLTTGQSAEIDKAKVRSGAAPNFVHACDAAHLMRTINAAVAEGITSIATVHDSFGCLACHAGRFRRIIREEFVRMYAEHDVLAEVLEQACRELAVPEQAMPTLPTKGAFDIRNVLDADFAFA